MKALVCRELGSIHNLELINRSRLTPGRDEVLIAVKAAGINFPDMLTIQGKYQETPQLPFVPGTEVAGVIDKVGERVTGVSVGDRVFAKVESGAFAQECLARARDVYPMGERVSFEQASGLTITYGTSYYALKQRANLRPNETVLVLGAAGGVGIATIQLAKAMGAKVIAAASSEEKLDFACDAGADMRINYVQEDLKERTKTLTAGAGADVVYDPVGGDLAEQALRATAWDGRYLVIGFASGTIPKVPLNLPLLKGASVMGVWWGQWVSMFPHDSATNFQELIQMIDDGRLSPRVSEVYPFDQYELAFLSIAERRALGKIVFTSS